MGKGAGKGGRAEAVKMVSNVHVDSKVTAADDVNDADAPMRGYTMKEIESHSTPEDCWVVIDGNVYDVSKFVPSHPGGAMIYVKAGGDCSQLFDAYHPIRARKVLPKYLVGHVTDFSNQENPEKIVMYQDDSEFYTTMKRRVEAHFKKHNKDPRFHPEMYAKSAIILAMVLLSWYVAFFVSAKLETAFSPLVAFLAAVSFGFWRAEVGVSIQHDANHGSYCKNGTLCYLMGLTLDLVGASSYNWKQMHVNGHHAYTNLADYDLDVRVNEADIRRVSPQQPWHKWHVYQHAYLGFLYGLLSIKSMVDDFKMMRELRLGPTVFTPALPKERAIFYGGKAFSLMLVLGVPVALSPWGAVAAFGLYLVEEFACGWTLAMMFQVAHVTEKAAWPQVKDDGKVDMGWASSQVATTVNFAPRSWFWTHISGGLNHQIEHHVFPGVCHCHYPFIAPVVEETCKEFDVPYVAYDTFWTALKAHFGHMATMGNKKVPTLGDA